MRSRSHGEGNWKIAGADLAKFMFDRFSYRGQPQEFCVVFPLEVVAEKCLNFNEPADGGASSGEPGVVTGVLAVDRPGILPGSLQLRSAGKMPVLLAPERHCEQTAN